eukprot:gene6613-7686_t
MSIISLILSAFYAVFVTILSGVTLHLSYSGLLKLTEVAKPFSSQYPGVKEFIELVPTNFTGFNLTHTLLFAVVITLLATASRLTTKAPQAAQVYSTKKAQ